MTIYEKIKTMTKDEMRDFCYWIYLMGNADGKYYFCDSPSGYFGGYFLDLDSSEIMPNDQTYSLFPMVEKAIKENREYAKKQDKG